MNTIKVNRLCTRSSHYYIKGVLCHQFLTFCVKKGNSSSLLDIQLVICLTMSGADRFKRTKKKKKKMEEEKKRKREGEN